MSGFDEFLYDFSSEPKHIEIMNDNKDELEKETEWFQTSAYKITNKEIEALKNKKILALNINDEYIALIKYYGEDKDEN